MNKIEAFIKRSLRWYFTKNALPYWCMLLMDSAIIVGAGLCIYWILHRTQSIFDNRIEVLYSLLVYTLVSWIGARLFHTYQGGDHMISALGSSPDARAEMFSTLDRLVMRGSKATITITDEYFGVPPTFGNFKETLVDLNIK